MLSTTKLKLASLLPAVAILAACANSPVYPQQAHTTPAPQQNVNMPSVANMYSCEDNSSIHAQYIAEGNQVVLTATVPEVKWVNQPVTLNIATSGSGMRYINTASPNVTHEWQAKGNDGILTINWATGEEYKIICRKTS